MASPAVATRHSYPTVLASAPGHRLRLRRRGNLPSKLGLQSLASRLKVNALFGWLRGDTTIRDFIPPAESYTLTGSASEVGPKPREVSISVVSSIMDISAVDWDACACDPANPEMFNPFLTHAFLSSLEESGSAVKETGWLPFHVVARDEDKSIIGVVPLYLKSHSRGEFVFDHSWAEAYYSYGLEYYPKLQSCVPFTPVTGQRILLRNTSYQDQVFYALVEALKSLTAKMSVSSLHITFPSEGEFSKLKDSGLLQRIGMQYHWRNRNYKSFDEFLMDLKQPKRKNIRQERKKIPAQNLKMKRLRGDEIKSSHWDTFYKFYRNTTDNHWGRPYLTRKFFHLLGEKMGDKVMLIVAEHDDKLVAGALNLIGCDTLFGRLWGCLPDAYFSNLYFEACYYQAIEAAIELKLRGRLDQRILTGKTKEIDSYRNFFCSSVWNKGNVNSFPMKYCSQILISQEAKTPLLALGFASFPKYEANHELKAYYHGCIITILPATLQSVRVPHVEAGAQGEHKIQRGYLPVTTYSCHYFSDPGFAAAIGNFLAHETAQVKHVVKVLHGSGPYKDDILKEFAPQQDDGL